MNFPSRDNANRLRVVFNRRHSPPCVIGNFRNALLRRILTSRTLYVTCFAVKFYRTRSCYVSNCPLERTTRSCLAQTRSISKKEPICLLYLSISRPWLRLSDQGCFTIPATWLQLVDFVETVNSSNGYVVYARQGQSQFAAGTTDTIGSWKLLYISIFVPRISTILCAIFRVLKRIRLTRSTNSIKLH